MVSTKVATSKVITTRKRNIKSALKKISNVVASQRIRSRNLPADNNAPIILGRRAVVRSQIPVPVKLFVALHKLYKEDSIRATSVLSSRMDSDKDEPTRKINVALRCAIQELWEE